MDEETLYCGAQLRAFQVLAARPYNVGSRDNWEYCFKAGIDGWYFRLVSLEQHRNLIFEWHRDVHQDNHEPNAAIMLFCMDSAVECLVFALNALGWAFRPEEFHSVASEHALKRINPHKVIGDDPPGWTHLFPEFQQCFRDNFELWRVVADNHDVTKHRHQGFRGGVSRMDRPAGFFEGLGLRWGDGVTFLHMPMQQMPIPTHPKMVAHERPADDPAEWTELDGLYRRFAEFVKAALAAAVRDVSANFRLREPRFREDDGHAEIYAANLPPVTLAS